MQRAALVDGDVNLVRSAVIRLKKLEDDVAADAAINAINNAVSEVELSDSSTMLDYLKERISNDKILRSLEIPDSKKKDILARALRLDNFPSLTQIKKGLSTNMNKILFLH